MKRPLIHSNRGVTLVELMIAMALSGLIISAIYLTTKVQNRTASTQDDVSVMQQNLRAALQIMATDIRTAGYDPEGSGNPTIEAATSNSIQVTMDYDESGTIENTSGNPDKEDITYTLDTSTLELRRETDSTGTVADHIEYIEFYYTLEDGTQTLAPTDPDDIRSIQISILGRSRIADPNYTNTIVYETAGGMNPVNGLVDTTTTYSDGYRRRLLTTNVKCRNMGL